MDSSNEHGNTNDDYIRSSTLVDDNEPDNAMLIAHSLDGL